MSAPRIEIDLSKIEANTRYLVDALGTKGIGVTAVTKGVLGSAPVANAMAAGGAAAVGDSRVENLQALCSWGVESERRLIRTPMLSQIADVVAIADLSFVTERSVVTALSEAAASQGNVHPVVLMVELGDLREGVMPADVLSMCSVIEGLSNVTLVGLGANLACFGGVATDQRNMGELGAIVGSVEERIGRPMRVVSGGNSSSLGWALHTEDTGRINDLRLGESLLLGLDPLTRLAIPGLHTDAISIVGEVIESNDKPANPWGTIQQTAFGAALGSTDLGISHRSLVALGHHDTDPHGLTPPKGVAMLGASSDHLVLRAPLSGYEVGAEVRFGADYSSLIRAMASPFMNCHYVGSVAR